MADPDDPDDADEDDRGHGDGDGDDDDRGHGADDDDDQAEQDLPLVRFPSLADEADLAAWVGTSNDDLRHLLDDVGLRYRSISLRKRRGDGVRQVYAVESRLAAIQKALGRSIAAASTPPPHVFGFVKGGSTVKHAQQHVGRALVLRVDLRDFFGSVTGKHVREAFALLGASGSALDALVRLCTLDDRLPQGASSSPALSNLAARHLDADLLALAGRIGCTYTRYADDLVFSGDTVVDVAQVTALAAAQGFAVNPDKTRLQKRGRAQYVNGLTVGERDRPHVPRALKRALRSELRLAARFGFRDRKRRKRLYGLVAYVSGIDGALGERLRALYDAADHEHGVVVGQGKTSSSP
ncbi:MAG TPA: reverse transcriptase family protein [Kofleriaceae bacterium]|nr:reverse transcriptase family protein [Kofleriaceae bacterium]